MNPVPTSPLADDLAIVLSGPVYSKIYTFVAKFTIHITTMFHLLIKPHKNKNKTKNPNNYGTQKPSGCKNSVIKKFFSYF